MKANDEARAEIMTQDLSVHHHPVHPLFLPTDQCAAAEYALSKEQIEFFHEYGYLKGIRILSDEQVEVLRSELAGLLTREAKSEIYFTNTTQTSRVIRITCCSMPWAHGG